MVVNQQDKQQVEEVIQERLTAFADRDSERLKALWDQDYPLLIYIAEENDKPLLDWAGIREYHDAVPDVVESFEYRIKELKVDVLGEAAYAYLAYLVKAGVSGVDTVMEFDGRATYILRKTAGHWKIIHYHESLSRDHSHQTWGFVWS